MGVIPSTRYFGLKRSLYRWCGATVGSNVRIVSSARFYLNGKLAIGDNTWVGHEALIIGGAADISIGDNCDIGPRVSLVTGSHRFGGLEDGVWLGASVTVLGGVTIGAGSMVAAGALVREDVSTSVVVAGVPAKIVRDIVTQESE
jgi:maltose O-acetyltransferase